MCIHHTSMMYGNARKIFNQVVRVISCMTLKFFTISRFRCFSLYIRIKVIVCKIYKHLPIRIETMTMTSIFDALFLRRFDSVSLVRYFF